MSTQLLKDRIYYKKYRRILPRLHTEKRTKQNNFKIKRDFANSVTNYYVIITKIYALPKIHKPILPLRSIICCVDFPIISLNVVSLFRHFIY